jgi:hypothetical protein
VLSKNNVKLEDAVILEIPEGEASDDEVQPMQT